MQIKCKQLKWDSDFFLYKIAEAVLNDFSSKDFPDLTNYFYNKNYRLVYLYPYNNVIYVELTNCKIPFTDTKVIFHKKSNDFTNKYLQDSHIATYSKDRHDDNLKELAFRSGMYSRFRLDPNFANNEFERLYTEWINRSVDGKIADEVLVYEINKVIAGFVSYKVCNKKLTIGLIAVSESYKGNGIGKSLMNKIENIASHNNVKEVEVATQLRNIEASSFYKACNYKIKSKNPVFHLWIS